MQADVFLAPQIYAAIERTKIDMVPLSSCHTNVNHCLQYFFNQTTANETCFFAAVKLPHSC
jgi:hypothetical protein